MKKRKGSSKRKLTKSTRGEIYVCTGCKIRETIPEDVLDYFDLINPRSPFTGPHVFSCERCGKEMYPEKWLKKQERVTD